ncbi:MAG: hypothetical protein ACRD3Q_12755 [Terriglobales bacterium]
MRQKLILVLFLIPSLLGVVRAQADSPPNYLQLYDNFNELWLDPAKWAPTPTCSETQFLDTTASINVVDCIRAIEANKLRLMVRAYGNVDSDTDMQFGPSELYFADPEAINTINVAFRIAHSESVACPFNRSDSIGQVLIGGNFFNSGNGNPLDDVTAFVMVRRGPTLTKQDVLAGAAVFSKNIFYGWVDLGTPDLDGTLHVTVSWDQPNHRFRFRLVSASGDHNGNVPYIGPDSLSPAEPMKLLAARTFAPNCTTQPTSATMDVLFDNVFVNQ